MLLYVPSLYVYAIFDIHAFFQDYERVEHGIEVEENKLALMVLYAAIDNMHSLTTCSSLSKLFLLLINYFTTP